MTDNKYFEVRKPIRRYDLEEPVWQLEACVAMYRALIATGKIGIGIGIHKYHKSTCANPHPQNSRSKHTLHDRRVNLSIEVVQYR